MMHRRHVGVASIAVLCVATSAVGKLPTPMPVDAASGRQVSASPSNDNERLLYDGVIEGGVRIGKSVVLSLIKESTETGKPPKFRILGTFLGPFSVYEYATKQTGILEQGQDSFLHFAGVKLRIVLLDYSDVRVAVKVWGVCDCTELGIKDFERVFDGTLSTGEKLQLGKGHYLAVDQQNPNNDFCLVRLYNPSVDSNSFHGQMTFYTNAPRTIRIGALRLRIRVSAFEVSSNGNASVRMTVDKLCDCALFDCRGDS